MTISLGRKFLAFITGSMTGIVILAVFALLGLIKQNSFWTIVAICWFSCAVVEKKTDATAREIAVDMPVCFLFVILCGGTQIIHTDLSIIKSMGLPIVLSSFMAAFTSLNIERAIESWLKIERTEEDGTEEGKELTGSQVVKAASISSTIGLALVFIQMAREQEISNIIITLFAICYFSCFISEVVTNAGADEVIFDLLISAISIPFGMIAKSHQNDDDTVIFIVLLSLPVVIVSILSARITKSAVNATDKFWKHVFPIKPDFAPVEDEPEEAEPKADEEPAEGDKVVGTDEISGAILMATEKAVTATEKAVTAAEKAATAAEKAATAADKSATAVSAMVSCLKKEEPVYSMPDVFDDTTAETDGKAEAVEPTELVESGKTGESLKKDGCTELAESTGTTKTDEIDAVIKSADATEPIKITKLARHTEEAKTEEFSEMVGITKPKELEANVELPEPKKILKSDGAAETATDKALVVNINKDMPMQCTLRDDAFCRRKNNSVILVIDKEAFLQAIS